MNKIRIIIDVQNDFITGSLGTPEAKEIIPKIMNKIIEEAEDAFYVFTMDTHTEDYLNTPEGKKLPVKHCIKETEGWKIESSLVDFFDGSPLYIEKTEFGTFNLIPLIDNLIEEKVVPEECDIEICGLVTNICVITNALILKAAFPNNNIIVNSELCAGTTPEAHRMALEVMKNCQIEVI